MKLPERRVYRHADLAPILNPERVAIVGISPSERGAGARALGQLRLLGFEGKIDLVNAKYLEIGDMPCHPSIASLDGAPDVVIITVPQMVVEDVLLDAASAGAKAAIVFAAGYADTGRDDRRGQQERLSSIAMGSGIKIIGPNCLGAVNYAAGAALTYTNTPLLKLDDGTFARPHGRSVGLVSQSGGLGFAAAQAIQRGVSISHILTSGNSCDVDVADYVAYLAEEPSCTSIACVFEAIPDAGRLLEAADVALRAGKPIVVHKLGTGESGAAAAMTHSGMLAGSHDAFLAAFAEAGMTVVDDFDELMETAAFFAKADRAAEKGVVVLTSSGGASVMAADKAELHGVELPGLDEPVRDALQAKLPDFATARNPCDVTGGLANDLEGYLGCVDLLLAEPSFGTLVTAHPYSVHTANRVLGFGEIAAKHDKRVCNVWITEHLAGSGLIEAERDERQSAFRSMDHCFRSIAAWHRWLETRGRHLERREGERLSAPDAAARAKEIIAEAGGGTITERPAKSVLAAYGVETVAEALAADAGQAADAADRLGYPVVLKIESPDIPHKTEFGAIEIGLGNRDEVLAAAGRILDRVRGRLPEARIEGLLVQPMITDGVELFVGSRLDPVFGPMLVLALGGIFVEVLKDRQLATVPVDPARAAELLSGLRGSKLLQGYRGGPSVDIARLAETVSRISELLADFGDAIDSIDVNPIICTDDRIVAVDALIVPGR